MSAFVPEGTQNHIKDYQDQFLTPDQADVGFLVGGSGADVLIGAYGGAIDNDGDNDYFFVNVSDANNNDGRDADTIVNFYVSGSDLGAEDYLVFSAAQLGLNFDDYSGFFDKEIPIGNSDWLKPGIDSINGYALPLITNEHWFKVGGIDAYESEVFKDEKFAFVLDELNGNLYFDHDGDRDVGDEYLVAQLNVHENGDNLEDMHADQIILIENDFDYYLIA